MRRTEEPPGAEFVLLQGEEAVLELAVSHSVQMYWITLCALSAPARGLLFSPHTLISRLLFYKQLFSISLESSSRLPFFIKMAFSARSRCAKGHDESGKVSLLDRSWLHVSLWLIPTSKNQRSWPILWVVARLFSRTGCCWPNNQLL